MKRFAIFALVTLLFGPFSLLDAQQDPSGEDRSLEETLQKLSKDASSAYVSPIVSGFGGNLNSGWFHRAPRATMFGIDLEFGVVGMGTFFKDEHKQFNTSGTFRFDSSQAFDLTNFINTDAAFNPYPVNGSQRRALQQVVITEMRKQEFSIGIYGPTIVGGKSDTVRAVFRGKPFNVTDPNTNTSRTVNVPSDTIPVGDKDFYITGYLEEAKAIPLVAPQLTIGTFFGTQFTFRYLPDIDVEDFGKIKYFGFGVQHNPGVWFGDILPLDVSASFFTQTLEAGTVFKTKATAFGVNASKRLGWGFLNLTPYAGFMVESSSMTFGYDFIVDNQKQRVEFELTGENKTRITAGVSIKVLIVNINADYNWSKYNSASVGVMFII